MWWCMPVSTWEVEAVQGHPYLHREFFPVLKKKKDGLAEWLNGKRHLPLSMTLVESSVQGENQLSSCFLTTACALILMHKTNMKDL